MGYEIMKSFKIDKKNLTISGRYASSNTYNADGTRYVDDFIQKFDTIEEFEQEVVVWANRCLEGTAKFSPSMTFNKRVNWLVKNGFAYSINPDRYRDWKWYQLENTREVVDVLTGTKKVKTPLYAMVSVSQGCVLKNTQSGIRLNYVGKKTKEELAHTKGRKVSKLTEEQVEMIKSCHKNFLEFYNVEVVAL